MIITIRARCQTIGKQRRKALRPSRSSAIYRPSRFCDAHLSENKYESTTLPADPANPTVYCENRRRPGAHAHRLGRQHAVEHADLGRRSERISQEERPERRSHRDQRQHHRDPSAAHRRSRFHHRAVRHAGNLAPCRRRHSHGLDQLAAVHRSHCIAGQHYDASSNSRAKSAASTVSAPHPT